MGILHNLNVTFKRSPFRRLVRDAFIVVPGLPSLVYRILWPMSFGVTSKNEPVSFRSSVTRSLFQAVLLLWSLAILTLLAASTVFQIGLPLTFTVFYLANRAISSLQGKIVVKPENLLRDKKSGEKWFFVNGVATTRSGVQLIQEHLFHLFRRPVYGIHNRTLGLVSDLFECILQRDLAYHTADIRDGYPRIKKALRDESTKKVVLIAHSQGGIVVSAWIDMLLAEAPRSHLSKLEVYTFASAANHFHSPVDEDGKHIIQHVEHFANEHDPIAELGVVSYGTAFYGQKHVWAGRTGHLFLEHYLSDRDDRNFLHKYPMCRLAGYLNGGVPEEKKS